MVWVEVVLDDCPGPASQKKLYVAILWPLVGTDGPNQVLKYLKKMKAILILKLIDGIN